MRNILNKYIKKYVSETRWKKVWKSFNKHPKKEVQFKKKHAKIDGEMEGSKRDAPGGKKLRLLFDAGGSKLESRRATGRAGGVQGGRGKYL